MRIELGENHAARDEAYGNGLKLLPDAFKQKPVGHHLAGQDDGIRVGDTHEVHDEVGHRFGSIIDQFAAQRIALLAEAEDLAHADALALAGNLEPRVVVAVEKAGLAVETYAGGNGLHTVHAPAGALQSHLNTHAQMAHLAGIEMAATHLLAVDDQAGSDTRADVDVNEVVNVVILKHQLSKLKKV